MTTLRLSTPHLVASAPEDHQISQEPISDSVKSRVHLHFPDRSRTYAGLMFWLSRSTFLGSYFFLISTRRA